MEFLEDNWFNLIEFCLKMHVRFNVKSAKNIPQSDIKAI